MTLPVHRPAPAPVRFQRTPGDDARGVRPGPDLDEERAWFRRAFRREIAALTADVADVLAAHPALAGGADAVEYATAVRLYLSAAGDGLDEALRSAAPGGHVPFARCVSAGVRRLPVHRGVAYAGAELTTADLRRIAQRRVLTDWGFTNALAEPPADLPGTVEVLIWSATARRTAAFETGDGVPARVLFLPGTAFTVLEVQEPEAGAPARLLVRELAVEEPPVDGRVRSTPSPWPPCASTSRAVPARVRRSRRPPRAGSPAYPGCAEGRYRSGPSRRAASVARCACDSRWLAKARRTSSRPASGAWRNSSTPCATSQPTSHSSTSGGPASRCSATRVTAPAVVGERLCRVPVQRRAQRGGDARRRAPAAARVAGTPARCRRPRGRRRRPPPPARPSGRTATVR